ncbi:hypothetical protein AVEN_204940-1 [Araneus ventricosus]|uniref:Uncharacterized protein n=1 Tax=Araneus ventricosus TaxID=182803 RepID=A0A4Y2VF69_ARAVE|nr:hypothetical protein AVEN_204940-1 [Araneus ventricosus]
MYFSNMDIREMAVEFRNRQATFLLSTLSLQLHMVINNMGHTPTMLLTVAILKIIWTLTPPILAHDIPSKHLAQLTVNFDWLYVQKLQYKPILAVTLHYDTPLTPEIKPPVCSLDGCA